MKILISGGAGFIGSHLCVKLHELNYEVVIMDNLSPQIHSDYKNSYLGKLIEGKCKLIEGNVCNKNDWRNALEGVDIIVHLAAETGTGQSMYEIEKYYNVNVIGTSLLMDILTNEQHQIKKIIVASSRAVYGEGKYKDNKNQIHYPENRVEENLKLKLYNPIDLSSNSMLTAVSTDEKSLLHPSSIYGLTKLSQEQLVLMVGSQINLPTIALRFQNVYGPGQSLSNPYTGLLAIFSNRIRLNKELEIYEDGLETRDFVFIEDVVQSFILSIQNTNSVNQIFNIGSGTPSTIIQVANLMCEMFGKKSSIIISGKYRKGDIRHNFADISNAKEQLGYSPKFSLERGLEIFVKWVNTQEIVEDKYDQSIIELTSKGLMKNVE